MSNRFDPDQPRHSVGPDLGPMCLRRSAAGDKICYCRQRVNMLSD